MKYTYRSAFVIGAAVLCTYIPQAFGQAAKQPDHSKYKPKLIARPLKAPKAKLAAIKRQGQTGDTIPLWGFTTVASRDGNTYSGVMVGRSPFYNGHRSTTIQVYLIPVSITFQDTGDLFDPSLSDFCLSSGGNVDNVVQNSPIVQNAAFTMGGQNVGTTQYEDAFQRANFWQNVNQTPYHTLLNVTTLNPVSVSVPASNGVTETGTDPDLPPPNCHIYGNLDIDWWDNLVQTTLLPSLPQVTPDSLPVFIFDSVVMYEAGDPDLCCVGGYHSAFFPSSFLQTYAVVDFDASESFSPFFVDISVMSHEVAEWMDDPAVESGGNPTPGWSAGQASGECQTNLEVGDPLTGTLFPAVPLNGFTYNPQELAFYSWFFGAPSIGAGGVFSNNGTFTTDAGPSCSQAVAPPKAHKGGK